MGKINWQSQDVGCGPVAAGQVIYYFRDKVCSVPDSQEWDWNLLSKVSPCWAIKNLDSLSTLEKHNAARFMSEVKYQCNMKPTDKSCTVGDVKRCLKAFGFQDVKHDFAHFGGSCDDMTHIDNNITYMIKNNKPVIMLSGAMNNVDGIFGHVFVLDGYKKDSTGEYVHINWGWWGASDGYYAKGCFDLNERAGCDSGIDAGNEATEKDNYNFFHYYVYYVM